MSKKTGEEIAREYRNRVKYHSTEQLMSGMRTDYIFIRDTYRDLEKKLQEQWIRIIILDNRLNKKGR